jgi:hypothetical protein
MAIAYLASLMVLLPAWRGDAADPANDPQSLALTDYLHSHRLPLVGAELIPHPGGTPQLVLFGFTATDFGKHDAVTKARRFLHGAPVAVTNRIIVRPELLSLKAPAPATRLRGSAAASNNQISAYENQAQRDQQQYAQQQYANQGAGSTLSTVLPLLGIGAAILGLGMGFGNFGGGIGMPYGAGPGYGYGPGYAPYGPQPPPGYPPYAPPPGGYGVFP